MGLCLCDCLCLFLSLSLSLSLNSLAVDVKFITTVLLNEESLVSLEHNVESREEHKYKY